MALAAARNLFKAWTLVVVLAALFGGLGWIVARDRGLVLFVVCSLLAALGAYGIGDRALLGMLGARPFALAEDPLLRSTVDRLAAQLGVVPPKLFIVDELFPLAFAVGRGPRSSTLAVSTGLLGGLPPRELEAVLAHELAHVRARDVLTQTYAVLVAATLLEATRLGGWLSRSLVYALGPVASAFVHTLLSPRRELAADTAAAALCGWEEIADAILRLDRAADLAQYAGSPATEPLFTVSPFAAEGVARMFVTHPAVERRVEQLRVSALEPGA